MKNDLLIKKSAALFLLMAILFLSAQKQIRTFPDMEDKLGTHFPIENFKDKNGKNYSPEYLKGKTTFINLWSTTCAPCLKELPFLNKLQKYSPHSLFIGITYDHPEKVNNFLITHDFNFYQITDAGQQLKSYLVIQRLPMSFIVDKNGIIKEIIGIVNEDNSESILKSLNEE
ncbi:TlpA family protein disulfide reductase [Chryseobacterium tongliaoense]|uniref:TlpA family protein disulfide reductase n=1 Tax=Chryseobacterium tongliaoense TaxID=3240933 RepID=UPI003518EE57